MELREFRYNLPADLIAQQPPAERGASRLLHLNGSTGQYDDRRFADILDLVSEADLMVFNDTKVIPARLLGRKQSGGRVEVLVERVLDDRRVLAQVRASKTPKAGTSLIFDEDIMAHVQGREDEFFKLAFDTEDTVMAVLERIGKVPLPPYIERDANADDERRYQTVYATKPGAVAAPTAGLHFDEATLKRLRERGVELAHLTLHVGAGTFQPVRVDDLSQHRMHSEWIEVPDDLVAKVAATRRRGGKVIAVGTTVVRSLESAARAGQLGPFRGETDIFITPGFEFRVVDALLTNFHLPESTLLMLVCAFGGYDNIMRAYRHAVEQRYRFFSYGDAMYIERET